MGNLERVELEVIWEKRDKKKTCILFVKTVETDRQHTQTHTGGFCCNHTHFFLLLDNYSLGCKEPGERSARECCRSRQDKDDVVALRKNEKIDGGFLLLFSLCERREFLSPRDQSGFVGHSSSFVPRSPRCLYKRSSRRARSWLKSRNVD